MHKKIFALERAVEYYSFKTQKRNRHLAQEYKREFRMEPPEYLLPREIKDQLDVRREMRR